MCSTSDPVVFEKFNSFSVVSCWFHMKNTLWSVQTMFTLPVSELINFIGFYFVSCSFIDAFHGWWDAKSTCQCWHLPNWASAKILLRSIGCMAFDRKCYYLCLELFFPFEKHWGGVKPFSFSNLRRLGYLCKCKTMYGYEKMSLLSISIILIHTAEHDSWDLRLKSQFWLRF